MKIAVIGYGNVGRTLGRGWLRRGHEVVYGARDPDSEKVREFRAQHPALRVIPVEEAIQRSELAALATPYEGALQTAEKAGDWEGRIVLDCTNPIGPGLKLLVGHTTSGAEEIAKRARGATVVKSFHTTGWENMDDSGYPGYGNLKPVMFVCGDDPLANRKVCGLAQDLGFEAVDWGPLEGARYLEPMAMVWIIPGRVKGWGPDFAFALLRRHRPGI
jgi:hypothetical protein